MQREVFVTTPRLILRQMEPRDAADLCRIVTLPEVGRMLFLFPPDWTVDAAETFIAHWKYHGGRPFRLAIEDGQGRFIGTVGVFSGHEPAIFYFLDPACAGRGFATEAVAGFIGWVAAEFGLDALRAEVFDDNPGSQRVLAKLGFYVTGYGMGTSAARYDAAPMTFFRLWMDDFRNQR